MSIGHAPRNERAEFDRACDAVVAGREAEVGTADQVVLPDAGLAPYRWAGDREILFARNGGVHSGLDGAAVVSDAVPSRSEVAHVDAVACVHRAPSSGG